MICDNEYKWDKKMQLQTFVHILNNAKLSIYINWLCSDVIWPGFVHKQPAHQRTFFLFFNV